MKRASLAHRAEQALLGGLMAGGDHGPVRHMRVDDLQDPRHQAIFLALTGQAEPAPGLGERLGRAGRRAAEVAAYMEELPARCPDPRHLAEYAAMVTAQRQQAAPQPGTPAGAEGQLDSAGAELERMTAPGRGRRGPTPAGVTPGVARLARALRPVVVARTAEWARAAAERLAGVGSVERTPGHLRDLVLASLLQHPLDGRGAAARIEPGELFEGGRRRLYEALRSRVLAGQPSDSLIIACQIAGPGQSGEELPAVAQVALALGDVPVMAGTARVLGRALLADAVLTEALGDQWTKVAGITSRLQLRADAESAAQQPEPATGQTPAHAARQPAAGPQQWVAARPVPGAQEPRPPESGNGIAPRT